MTTRGRWAVIMPVAVVMVAVACGVAGAADRSRVDQATQQVEHGAKRIGDGHVGSGFKQLFTGIGRTVVEGAKFSGETIKEFFKK
jgi:hypothetical protein